MRSQMALGSITTNKASGDAKIPVELCQTLKDDAVKMLHSICQQIWKTQQWPQDWKGQFSFQSHRRAIPKNVQTTTQLHSTHRRAKQCSKFSKSGFNSTWTTNFQMFKLDLEKAEEPEIKLPASVGSWKNQESARKRATSALLTMPKPLTVWITTNWKILKEMGIPNHLTCHLRNLYAGQEATVRTGHGTTDWFQITKGVCQSCIV